MAKLRTLARLIRSKNAGPFELTIDIIFADDNTYQSVKQSGVINRELFAQLYRVPRDQVLLFTHDRAFAFKASIPRTIASGDPEDGDVFGGQLHGPLVDLEISVGRSPESRAAEKITAP